MQAKPTLNILLARLRNADARVRRRAVEELRSLNDPATVDALLDALLSVLRKDPDEMARAHAATALGDLGDARALGPLLESLDLDRSQTGWGWGFSHVQEAAKKAIWALKAPGTADLAFERFLHRDDWTNHFCGLLVGLKDPRVVDLLLPLLDPPVGRLHGYLLKNAIEVLGLIGDRRAVGPIITKLTDEPGTWDRSTAATALGRLGDSRAVDSLVTVMLNAEEDDGLRKAATEALGKIGDPRAIELLVQTLTNPSLCTWAVDALDAIGNNDRTGALDSEIGAAIQASDVDQIYTHARTPGRINAHERSSELLRHGEEKERNGDLVGAIADYDDAVRIDPRSIDAYVARGHAKQLKGDLDGAIADYDRAVQREPRSVIAYSARGDSKQLKGDLNGAIADYDQIIQLSFGPRFPVNLQPASGDYFLVNIYCKRGEAKQLNGDSEGAIADYNQAIQVGEEHGIKKSLRCAQVYVKRGLARQLQGDLNGAIADYSQAIQILEGGIYNPALRAQAYQNRSCAKRLQGDLSGASSDHAVAETARSVKAERHDEIVAALVERKRWWQFWR